MNDLTVLDYYIRGAMVGAGMLTFGALCWWMARQGRKRWSVSRRERCSVAARLVQVGHGGS